MLFVKESARKEMISGEKSDLKIPIESFKLLVPPRFPPESESGDACGGQKKALLGEEESK
jgi:hypothetical protein